MSGAIALGIAKDEGVNIVVPRAGDFYQLSTGAPIATLDRHSRLNAKSIAIMRAIYVSPYQSMWINADRVNLRDGPTNAATVIRNFNKGQVILGTHLVSGSWRKVVLPSGEGGWVFTRYLSEK
jgi:SH3-like domain-containing protein